MAEVYPSDNDLLALTSDAETGVEYIPTGTVPYYLEFRKLLYRMLLSSKRGNDLRVYQTGGLDIGVKPGKFWDSSLALISFAGDTSVTLVDEREDIFIYLNAAGSLVINEFAAWPDMTTTPHIRLARVTTAGGAVTALLDARDHHSTFMPTLGGSGGTGTVIENHTADDTLTEAESGSVHTNLGATGLVTLTLPASATAGTMFTFAVQAAQQFRVDPGTATIRDNSGQTADMYKWADGIGECLTLVANSSGDWITTSKYGVWIEEV